VKVFDISGAFRDATSYLQKPFPAAKVPVTKGDVNTMSIVSTIDNDAKKVIAFAAWIKSKLVEAGKDAPEILQDVSTDVTKAGQFVDQFFPNEARLVDFALALGPKVGAAIEAAGSAALANGLNVSLDAVTVKDLKAIWQDIEALFTVPK
jgi:hypothetical protein